MTMTIVIALLGDPRATTTVRRAIHPMIMGHQIQVIVVVAAVRAPPTAEAAEVAVTNAATIKVVMQGGETRIFHNVAYPYCNRVVADFRDCRWDYVWFWHGVRRDRQELKIPRSMVASVEFCD